MSNIQNIRKALWHLRHGGIDEYLEYRRRQQPQERKKSSLSQRLWKRYRLPKPWEQPDVTPRRRQIVVATILDEFSNRAFDPEWIQVPVTPGNWETQMREHQPELLFVESAWHGNNDAWRYGLSGKPWDKLRLLVGYCRDNNIPTVFWNKEDPAHYDDFIATAQLFDVVLTTDINMVNHYRTDLDANTIVDVLPFAAQPLIHNPFGRSAHDRKDVAFAGSYIAHKFPERREQMAYILGGAAKATPKLKNGFDIFARDMGGDPNFEYPENLQPFIRGSLSYDQVLTAYRQYRTFLNVNSVVNSPSMCARRIFEISSCGTPVITAPSPAIKNFYNSNQIIQCNDRDQCSNWIRALCRSDQLGEYIGYQAMIHTWAEHTYSHRVETILELADIKHEQTNVPKVSVLLCTNRPHNLRHALQQISHQKNVVTETVLLINARDFDTSALTDFSHLDVKIIDCPVEMPLGACYNKGLKTAKYSIVAKMDDDDFYDEYYLLEQVTGLSYSGAWMVGKRSHYIDFVSRNLIAVNNPHQEYRFTHLVAGPTIVGWRKKLDKVQFPETMRGEDTGLMSRVLQHGGTIFATSRFGFLRTRADDGKHTWSIDDANLLANSDVLDPVMNNIIFKSSHT